MNTEETKQKRRRLLIGIAIYATVFLLIVLIANLTAVNNWIKSLLMLFRPVLIGLALSYLCNPFFRFFERKLFSRLRPQGLRRALSLLLTYLAVLLILGLILLLIVPQLIESILSFVGNYNAYLSSAIAQINRLFSGINSFWGNLTGNDRFLEYLDEAALRTALADLLSDLDKLSTELSKLLGGISIEPIQNFVGGAISIVTDTIFGIFVSIYLLSTKEKRYAQVMKLRRALFSSNVNEHITRFCKSADRAFGGFLEGKLLGSLIVGVLTYTVISIFRIPYALLIATVIAIANIIPVIGIIIGVIPTALILLLAAPGKAIPFLIIMLIIQQIDVNIIGPKVLGNNTGISSLCVLIAITSMGTLWGPIGMILGVPLFATLIELCETYTVERLQKKGLPSGLANYYANDAMIDPVKNAASTADKLVQRFERKSLLVSEKQEKGEPLTRREAMRLRFYKIAHKYHFFAEMSDETHARLSAEQAATAAASAAELLWQQRRTPVPAEEPTPTPQEAPVSQPEAPAPEMQADAPASADLPDGNETDSNVAL